MDHRGLSAKALQQNNFVIVAQPRSGSYHLCSLLDSAADVICHGEVFKKEHIEISNWHAERLGIETNDVEPRESDPYGFLLKLRNLNPEKLFGFKAFPTHLTLRGGLYNKVLFSPNWRKIFLMRNPLESYGSLLRAKATQVWALHSDGGLVDQTKLTAPVTFEKQSFEKHFETYIWYHWLKNEVTSPNPDASFDIWYNDLGNMRQISELLSFIGSNAAADSLKSQRIKQFDRPLDQGFANWGEFETYLRDAGLGQHLPRP
jgi:LPS sulfotransferase NodH